MSAFEIGAGFAAVLGGLYFVIVSAAEGDWKPFAIGIAGFGLGMALVCNGLGMPW